MATTKTKENGRRGLTPSELPLREKLALFERLQDGRERPQPVSWHELAAQEGIAERTLEYFYRWATGLEKNADTRSVDEVFVHRLRATQADHPRGRRGGSRRGRGEPVAHPGPPRKKRAPGATRNGDEVLYSSTAYREERQRRDELRMRAEAEKLEERRELQCVDLAIARNTERYGWNAAEADAQRRELLRLLAEHGPFLGISAAEYDRHIAPKFERRMAT